ncbi:uncharacterized protein LOC134263470 [Saccostrea cucullata]|uniref:uncharacterized protein LOC134228470 n=1 Tax=Saccostrea cuccullata TaxID=36930 RepID=UPI002ED60FD4
MEKDSSVDRITQALSRLKSDLEDIRNQDVKLMKQLLAINSAITSITNPRTRNPIARSATFSCSGKKRPALKYLKKRAHDDVMCNLRNPLVRYGSEPLVVDDEIDNNGSMDSMEDLNAESTPSFPLSSSFNGKGSAIPLMSSLLEEDELDDAKYHGILMKNIRLWKQSKKYLQNSKASNSDVIDKT